MARAERVAEFRGKFANPYVAAARGFLDEVIRPRETRRKLIAANASQVAVITAGEPSVNDELVCRVLVAAECQGVRGLIVLNKTDLPAPAAALRARLEPFARAGYPIVEVSAKRDVASLRAHLVGGTTAAGLR